MRKKINTRMIRVNDEITKEIADIIRTEVKDPRIKSMTSVLRVETTSDLKYCKVYISVLGNDEEKESVMSGIKNAGGFIRHLLAERINLRNTPELIFKLDDSVEYAIKMEKLIKEISHESSGNNG
ncbi:MAG: 30S ribosome-binding factor RbfA [Clostridia bacterium]|jgi:ribosome-binding factor A|nr:30S ribosome-binding factor RbfA [Clostridia bacterium]MCI2000152.1 30S ribosome-binding factor RbfA [Clostridia bacterium]MCI2014683.1 30S ribosome-binding factor RbfA [Clostridia bacterium]